MSLPLTVSATATESAGRSDVAVVDENGSPLTIAEMYERHGEAVARFCARRLSNTGNADDACVETFLRAQCSASAFHSGQPVWPWLATIAANVCRDINRSQHREVLSPRPPSNEQAPSAYDEALRRSHSELLREALGHISERDRQLLYLRDVDGWSWAELAQREGRTVDGIRGVLYRAQTKLRDAVEEVALERHWPLPAVIGLVWNRLRRRATRARVRVDTAIARFSNHEGVVSLMANDTVARFTTGTVAALAVVVPMAIGTTGQDASSARQATENAVAVVPNDSDIDDAEPRPADSSEGTADKPDIMLDRTDGYLQVPSGEPAQPDGSAAKDGSRVDSAPFVPPPPEAESPEVPVSGTTSTGGFQSDDDGHEIEGPSGSIDLGGDDEPDKDDQINTGAAGVSCPREAEPSSTTMSVVCAPLDLADAENDTDDVPSDYAESSPSAEPELEDEVTIGG